MLNNLLAQSPPDWKYRLGKGFRLLKLVDKLVRSTLVKFLPNIDKLDCFAKALNDERVRHPALVAGSITCHDFAIAEQVRNDEIICADGKY